MLSHENGEQCRKLRRTVELRWQISLLFFGETVRGDLVKGHRTLVNPVNLTSRCVTLHMNRPVGVRKVTPLVTGF